MHNSEKLKLTLMYISIHTSVNCQKELPVKIKTHNLYNFEMNQLGRIY